MERVLFWKGLQQKDKKEIEPILKAKSNMVIHTEQALDETVTQIKQLLEAPQV